MTSTPRRSTRAKRPAASVYEDARVALKEQQESSPKKRARVVKKQSRREKEDDDDEEKEEVEEMEEEEEEPDDEEEDDQDDENEEEELDDDDDDDDDEDASHEEPVSRKSKKKLLSKSPSRTKKAKKPTTKKAKKSPSTKKVQVQLSHTRTPKKKKTTSTARGGRRHGKSKLLADLKKKTMKGKEEGGDLPLLADLFTSHLHKEDDESVDYNIMSDQKTTMYTNGLRRVARGIIEKHQKDPSRSHRDLLNLLFRCVGGWEEEILMDETVIVEDLDESQWELIVTDLVDDMTKSTEEEVLVCANPKGIQYQSALDRKRKKDAASIKETSHMVAVGEFRRIYDEFWFVLGQEALGDSSTPTRFQIETVESLIGCMNNLVTVGQPDIRAAATTASSQLALAVVQQTKRLASTLQIAKRQLKSASSSKKSQRSKAEGYKNQVDSITRTMKDMEQIVQTHFVDTVFIHRYRDTNPYIAATALDTISRMMIFRPDLFCKVLYLKYLGWMVHDTDNVVVRRTALNGILRVLDEYEKTDDERYLADMEKVTDKYLAVFVRRAVDPDISVQEVALKLLVRCMSLDLMESLTDEKDWKMVNRCSLNPDTSFEARKQALYFVIDQLEAFDEGEEGVKNPDKSVLAVQQLDTLAAWLGHTLRSDTSYKGDVPLHRIQIDLVDLVVKSLWNMPEHNHLVTDLSGLLGAIKKDTKANAKMGVVAKQVVLMRMLAFALELQVGDANDEEQDLDEDVIAWLKAKRTHGLVEENAKTKTKKKKSSKGTSERFQVELLESLPNLLLRFKTEPAVLRSLSRLPALLSFSVLNQSNQKKNVLDILKRLVGIFQDSSDEEVLNYTAFGLTTLAKGSHSRVENVAASLRGLVVDIRDRIDKLLKSNANTSSKKKPKERKEATRRSERASSQSSRSSLSSQEEKGDEHEESIRKINNEKALSLNLRRLYWLMNRINVAELLEEGTDDPHAMDQFCNQIVEAMKARLGERKLDSKVSEEDGEGDDESMLVIPDIWNDESLKPLHLVVAKSILSSLDILLLNLARSRMSLEGKFMDEDEHDLENPEEVGVVKQRDQLLALLSWCFEQFLPPNGPTYSDEQEVFSELVQARAGETAGDLRSLLPMDFANATSAVLRAIALKDDQVSILVSGHLRFLESKLSDLQALGEEQEDDGRNSKDLSDMLLRPYLRSIPINWKMCHRREVGFVLTNYTGSGPDAALIVTSLARKAKDLDQIRFLECHMACLRTVYDLWFEGEPTLESEKPTDQEMDLFARQENEHKAEFHRMEELARELSSTLGQPSSKKTKLSQTMVLFLKEGFRFAFSNELADESETLLPGARLSFLTLLSKYTSFIRKMPALKEMLLADLNKRETELREDPDYGEIHEDDLGALREFRVALGEAKSKAKEVSDSDDEDDEDKSLLTPVSSSTKARAPSSSGRKSVGSVSTIRSRLSVTHSSLSPLLEDDAEGEEQDGRPKEDANDDEDADENESVPRGQVASPIEEENGNDHEDEDEDEEGVGGEAADEDTGKKETKVDDVKMEDAEGDGSESSIQESL